MPLCGVLLGHGLSSADAGAILASAWKATGDPELAKRAAKEIPNTLRTTAGRLAAGNATGIPTMEKITPGLFEELNRALKLKADITVSGKSISTNLTNSTNPTNSTNSTNREPMTAEKLLGMEMHPVRWIVPDILPEGLTLLVGKPKKGKSWMAMGLAEAVAAGGVAFGTRRVEKGNALYLALEDNTRRLQKRLKKVLAGRSAPSGMYIETVWPRLEEGGATALDEWLTKHPEARLVVIDTLAKIRKPARGKNVYHEDYSALESLLPMAAKHGVAIVVIHHLRKGEAADPQDEISGSTGLAGGVDGFLILRRVPGSKGPTLYVDGRDIEEPAEYALHWNFNTATWTIEGTAEEVHLSRERQDILLVLNRTVEPMAPKEVADLLPGAKHNNVKYLMWQMAQDEQLVKVGTGKYKPANRTNPPTNRQTPHRNAENSPSVSGVSAVSENGPVSFDLKPGQSATVEQLQRNRERMREGVSEDRACEEDLREHAWDCICAECLPI
jgi:hypothetical protein